MKVVDKSIFTVHCARGIMGWGLVGGCWLGLETG